MSNLAAMLTVVFGSEEWHLDETLTDLIDSRAVEPIIAVGIDNAGRRGRAREYLPYPIPQGQRFADFLEREVIPFVESRFRARSDRASRTLGGSSYGALVALHVATSRPHTLCTRTRCPVRGEPSNVHGAPTVSAL